MRVVPFADGSSGSAEPMGERPVSLRAGVGARLCALWPSLSRAALDGDWL
jgi:hypothetical protein